MSIIANGLSITKQKTAILRELTFSLPQGKLIGLIGPSGAGKTTLMRAIVGIQQLSHGSLQVLDRPAGVPELRRRIGYVTQSPSVYGDLTVRQNLRFFATLLAAPKADIDRVLAAVDLNTYAGQLVDTLSGGQRARVSLAVALLGDPDVLVLDEPTIGLDPVLRNSLWKLFAALAGQGKTLLVSSHVMDEAERCEMVVLLREGQLLWADSRDELLKSQQTNNIEEAFIKLVSGDKS